MSHSRCTLDLSGKGSVCVFLRRFNISCYASGLYMLLFLRQMFMMRVCVCVCVCVCVFIGIVQRN